MKKVDWKEIEIKPHNILVSHTTHPDYEVSRQILLEMNHDVYIIVEGHHCSCYGFDETEWDAIEYTEEEIVKLSKAKYNQTDEFWDRVRNQFNI